MPLKKTPPVIEVKNLSMSYNGNVVLDRVSFAVNAGEYVGIVGPNGGGKTTLLKILLGLISPSAGQVMIDGIPLHEFRQKYEIGYVPQRISQDRLSFPATVDEVVESGRLARAGVWHRLSADDRNAVRHACDVAGIMEIRDRAMSSLSGGQRQRVYVARALAAEPRILLLDEPFVGIDVAAQGEFYAFLRRLNTTQKLTILFVSHDIDVITEEVKSVLCLNRGMMCFGKPSLLHEPHVIEKLYGRSVTHLHHPH